MKIEELKAYEVIEKRSINDLNSEGMVLRHKKTGAKVVLLSNEDENKVFYIGFRTPPKDSTGVAHILEHSVLCGSENFPVKDPFVELAKGSLNTFLNAMTYPDKTIYPVASCNDKDFQNLMHVYLDAVFYPNIYQEENIFKQEGWHYEMESMEDELSLNGVVYNEMKGAFSSPDDVMDREVLNSLFPHTTYGYESGGDPEVIPQLSEEEFKEFHSTYYHPSNSYIYLYGNMDMAEKLQFIEETYLSKFEKIQIDSSIEDESPFVKPVYVEKTYSITEGEAEEENTYLSYNSVIADSLDKELYVAFQILDYVLCSAPGAPVKQALVDKKIGKDIYSIYENGIMQPFFSIVAKNANLEQKEAFLQTIKDTLLELVKNGLDKKALKAALNYYEFKYREADFGSYPKGLMYGLQMLDSWLYDERTPFFHVEANHTFATLKEKIETDYFEGLIETYLISNPHHSVVTLVPERGLTAKRDRALKEKLETYKKELSQAEKEDIVEQTKALRVYQEKESSKEDLEKIPLLTREDIKKEAEGFVNEVKEHKGTTILFHPLFTNGIGYMKFLFDMKNVPNELLPYTGMLKAVLGLMNTEHFGYGDLFHEINIQTGGISTAVNTYTNAKDLKEYRLCFEVRVKVLYENLGKAFALIEEIITTTKYNDEKRLHEILSETKSRVQAGFTSSGHSLAAGRAMSYFSEAAAVAGMVNGIPFLRLLEKYEKNFEQEKEILIQRLQQLVHCIFRPENLMVDFTAEKEQYEVLPDMVAQLKQKLFADEVNKEAFRIQLEKKNEGFESSSQIQYVCRAGNFIEKGLPYTGALRVLRVMMGYDYLWSQVRVKGGAYGCMCNFGKTGDSYFVSYRDPNLLKTIEIYEKAADYIKNFDADERTIMQFIIGAVSELDTPLNPAAKGARSLAAYLSNQEEADIQRERDELLNVNDEAIKQLAPYIEAFMSENNLCVVGNTDKIKENKDLFGRIENLFQ